MPRKTKSYTPAVRPAVGIIVALDGLPGTWQITSQAPGHGQWWLTAVDDEARSAPSSGHGVGYAKATAPEMTRQ